LSWEKPTNSTRRQMSISSFKKVAIALATSAALAFTLSGCAPAATPEAAPTELQTLTAGKLTIGTGLPAYEPWVVGDAPESGEGFEAAVAYAIAAELGFAAEDVVWVRTTFDEAIAPGPKNFDFNLQQYSITPERAEAIDFSSPYYATAQTVITIEGSAAAGATSLADLKGLVIGAATGTTSFSAIENIIMPTAGAKAFNSNDDAKAALASGQVDAIVVDLPTAFYLTAVELDGGIILGQLAGAEAGDSFGLVLDKGSPLTAAVSAAVDALRANGKLAELEATWLADFAGAPVLK
jgi:polar amino acid transport system substrate-binding protein